MSYIDDYYAWLKSISFIKHFDNNVARLSLPFLDRNNDYTEIYIIRRSDTEYLLTDDGATYAELELSGFEFSSGRRAALNSIVNVHGVSINQDNAIYATADKNSLPLKTHMLTQCMMRVSDLFVPRKSNVGTLFTEDIAAFLDDHDIRYTPSITLIGKSKMPSQFDFIIPASKYAPERIIKAFNNLDNNSAKLLLFNWLDTRDNRNVESQLFPFINNIDKNIRASAVSGLSEYDITPVLWSKRTESVNRLTA